MRSRHLSITGAGGGGGGSAPAPVELPDSLHSTAFAQILDLVSEGEIHGLVNGAQSIFLNGTPLVNADMSPNFEGVEYHERHGTQTQDVIPGFPSSQAEVAVSVELQAGSPWTRTITNRALSAVRVRLGVPALSKLQDNGDLIGYRIDYVVELQTAGGAFVPVVSTAFDGKTTSAYERSHRIDLPPTPTNWVVRIRRLTAQANSAKIQDTTVVHSITTVIDQKLRYPMSALIGLRLDARQFSSLPSRAYHMRGRIIRVPSNYDPVARTYAGLWDGTFQLAYTNNPAWIYLDLATNDRYGLGELIPLASIDKWSLYRIGVYCDDRVDDGKGGTEPRFTCNLYLQSRADAWKVLQDLASVFRGISYYASGTVFASADIPADPAYTFTQANVIDGRFEYQGSPRGSRATVALVSWIDLTANGAQKVESVEDRAGIARYGLRQIELVAFGCTSQAQAQRAGKWALLSARLETDTVTFGVGLDGMVVMPGQVIRIADSARSGLRVGGRIRSATESVITTDADLVARGGDRLTVNLPSGRSETRTLTTAVGKRFSIDRTDIRIGSRKRDHTIDHTGLRSTTVTLTVSPPFSAAPSPGAIWTLESSSLYAQTFRVIGVSEREGSSDGAKTFTLSAVQHEAGKFTAVDFGTIIEQRPISVIPPAVMPAPASVTISAYHVISQGIAAHNARIEWPAVVNAVAYEVQWRRDNGEWVTMNRTGSTSVEITGIYAGTYLARVRALNALDSASIWRSSTATALHGKTSPPPSLAFLTASTTEVFAITLKWGFPAVPLDIDRTDIMYSATSSFTGAVALGSYAYPTTTCSLLGLAAGVQLWFWGRLVDKSGNLGPWFPVGAGRQGASSSSAAAILGYLTNQITRSQLGSSLLTEIDAGGAAKVKVDEVETDLAAMYTIKTQLTAGGRTYLAGIGVGVENNDGIVESQVLIAADRFAVIEPNGGTVNVPFVVTGGQVFIRSAFIENGSITSAKIVSLDANKIVATTLSAITANLGIVTAGTLRNSTSTAVMSLDAVGAANFLRVGGLTYYGPLLGSRYPVEISANGAAFFGREAISGGTLRAAGTYSIPLDERPAVVFITF